MRHNVRSSYTVTVLVLRLAVRASIFTEKVFMFISHQYRLVFLEVPRTASRSVSEALARLDPDAPTSRARRQNGAAVDYHRFQVDAVYLDDYCVVAAHRNPYHRLWSHWKHRRNHGNPEIFKTIAWPRYVEWACNPSAVPGIQGANHEMPIAEMFDCRSIDFWLSYEELERSWRELAMQYGLPLPELGSINRSETKYSFNDAYDGELAKLVETRFAADFELFGYSRDSWKP